MNVKTFAAAVLGAAISLGVGSVAPSEAATLSSDNTQIFGLDIGGNLYDVKFEDGSYNQVFTNTGRTPTFSDIFAAKSAAEAIRNFLNGNSINEVIPGAFDGVVNDAQVLIIPYIKDGLTALSWSIFSAGSTGTSWDVPVTSGVNITVDRGIYTTFTPSTPSTPIPSPALLPGVIGIGITALRKKRQSDQSEQVAETAKV